MNKNIIYVGNILLSMAIFALFYKGKISWEVATAFVATMLVPSGLHVAYQSYQDSKVEEPAPITQREISKVEEGKK